MIWTDEKIFALHMKVNKQNDRIWGIYNPREYRETKVNGDVKGRYLNDGTLAKIAFSKLS